MAPKSRVDTLIAEGFSTRAALALARALGRSAGVGLRYKSDRDIVLLPGIGRRVLSEVREIYGPYVDARRSRRDWQSDLMESQKAMIRIQALVSEMQTIVNNAIASARGDIVPQGGDDGQAY